MSRRLSRTDDVMMATEPSEDAYHVLEQSHDA